MSAAPIAVTPTSWGNSSRTLRVGARSETAVITVNENVNAGWVARAGGHALKAVTVDGWKQGYLLPAGAATTVTLTFTPQRSYSLALVVGALAVVALILLFVLSGRRRRPAVPPIGAWRSPLAPVAIGVVTRVLAGGVVGGVVVVAVGALLAGADRLPGPRRAALPRRRWRASR